MNTNRQRIYLVSNRVMAMIFLLSFFAQPLLAFTPKDTLGLKREVQAFAKSGSSVTDIVKFINHRKSFRPPNALPISALNTPGSETDKIENVRATRVTDNSFVIVYQVESSGVPEIKVMMGHIMVGGTVTFGTPVTIEEVNGNKSSNVDIAALDDSHLVVVLDSGNGTSTHKFYAVALMISGTDLILGPISGDNDVPVETPVSTLSLGNELRVAAISATDFVVAYTQFDGSSAYLGRAVVGVFDPLDGSVKFNGTFSDFGDSDTDFISLAPLDDNQAVVAYRSGGSQISAKILDVNVTLASVTAGAGFNAVVGTPCLRTTVAQLNDTQFLLAYEQGTTTTQVNLVKCNVVSSVISSLTTLNNLHVGDPTNSLTASKIANNEVIINVLETGTSEVYRVDATSDMTSPDVTDQVGFSASTNDAENKAFTVGLSTLASVSIAVVAADGSSGAYGHDQGLVALPEAKVLGDGFEIVSGATTTQPDDHTDFGVASVNDSLEFQFEIQNAGNADLVISSIASSNSLFTIPTSVSGLTVSPGGSEVFSIRYKPTTTTVAAPDLATITINSNDTASPFTFLVSGAAIVRLTTPTITDSSSTRNQISIRWTDDNTNEFGYDVYRAETMPAPPGGTASLGPFQLVFELQPDATTFTDFGLRTNTTYAYYVVAIAEDPSLNSLPSDTAMVSTLANAPVAPSALNALALSQTEIQLEWRDNSSNETGFEIFRRKAGETNFTMLTTLSSDTELYIDQDLDSKTEYSYLISATGNEGNSPPTDTATVATLSNAPGAPSDLLVEVVSGSELGLDWEDNSDNELGFVIYRSTEQFGTYSVVDTVLTDVVEYLDTSLTTGTTYYYYVIAYNNDGESLDPSNIASGVPQNVPLVPSNIQFNIVSNTTIEITWTIDNPPTTERTAQGFKIEAASLLGTQGIGQRRHNWAPTTFTNGKKVARTTNDGFSDLIFSEIGTTDASTTKFTATNLIPNQSYLFRLRAFNDNGNSPYTPDSTLVTPVDPSVPTPSAPSDLKVTSVSQSELDLTWKDNSADELVFKIERKRSSEAETAWVEIAQVVGGTTSFSSTDLLADSTYDYRVRASNQGGESAYSNVSSAKVECNLVVLVTNNSGTNTICSGKAALLVVNTNVSDATYQWKLNGINIENANLPIYNATETGEYNCQVISDGCSKSSTTPSVVISKSSFQVTISVTDSTTNTFTASVSGAQSYQWYRDYIAIEGATESVYQTAQDGTYFVVVSNEGCSSTSNLINWATVRVTGIEDNEFTKSISISPNPSATESVLQMNNEEFGPYKILITDNQGKVLEVMKGEKKTKKMLLDLPIQSLATGLYLVKIQMKEKESTKKLLKE